MQKKKTTAVLSIVFTVISLALLLISGEVLGKKLFVDALTETGKIFTEPNTTQRLCVLVICVALSLLFLVGLIYAFKNKKGRIASCLGLFNSLSFPIYVMNYIVYRTADGSESPSTATIVASFAVCALAIALLFEFLGMLTAIFPALVEIGEAKKAKKGKFLPITAIVVIVIGIALFVTGCFLSADHSGFATIMQSLTDGSPSLSELAGDGVGILLLVYFLVALIQGAPDEKGIWVALFGMLGAVAFVPTSALVQLNVPGASLSEAYVILDLAALAVLAVGLLLSAVACVQNFIPNYEEKPQTEPAPQVEPAPVATPAEEAAPAEQATPEGLSEDDLAEIRRIVAEEIAKTGDELKKEPLSGEDYDAIRQIVRDEISNQPPVNVYVNAPVETQEKPAPAEEAAPAEQPAPAEELAPAQEAAPVEEPVAAPEEKKEEEPSAEAQPAEAAAVAEAPQGESAFGFASAPKKKVPFAEKLEAADDDIKAKYDGLREAMLAYGIHERVSIPGATYSLHRKRYLFLTISGKHIKLQYALNPDEYANTPIPAQKAESSRFADVPLTFKVKSDLSYRRALKLIDDMMGKEGIVKTGKSEEVTPEEAGA